MVKTLKRAAERQRNQLQRSAASSGIRLVRGQAVALALLLLLGMGISSLSLAGEDPPDMEGMDDRAFKQRLREAEAELDAAARKLREVYQTRFTGKERPRKAMLGVLVDYGKRDDGVPLTGLTPGGGAEAAGLRARDVLISVNGVRLDDPDDGRSSMKALTQEMDKVAPGEEVLIGYRRRGNVAETTVTTRARQKDLNALLDSLDVDVDIDFDELGDEIAEAAESVAMSALALASQTPKAPQPPAAPAAPVDGLKQLAALTEGLTVSSTPDRFIDLDPDLAAYFGVEDGVLAVGMDGNGDGLKSGDVVLSLGGEPATDAASARAFLNAAQGSVPAEVLRKGETRVLELDSDRYQSDRRVSVIRISQDGDNVEVTIDADDD